MRRKRIITSTLVAMALCFAGLSQAVSAQDSDTEAAAAEAAEEAAAAAAAEAAAKAAEAVEVDPKMLAKYNDMLTQLRAELTPKLPKTDDPAQVDAFLKSDRLDAQLVKVAVLTEATPKLLAGFAQQSKENEALVDQLLANTELMKRMLIADGAKRTLLNPNTRAGRTGITPPCHYGQAMKIYTDILKASPKAKDGVLHELALAVALELAIPVRDTIDPVERYLDYEKAYLDGELDPAFANFSAWELRFVVDGNEPDWARAWGREMLRNYRPDHILTTSDGGRYVGMVRTNVIYGGTRTRQDRPELQNYQNILMNGGICGRRAFFGRFILRCFGIPSAARPSKAHGALVRWTPTGWIPYLGPSWGKGYTNTIYHRDRNFLATTQARVNKEEFIQVKRAQWAGDVRGEKRTYGGNGRQPDKGDTKSWGGVSLLTQQRIIDALKAVEQGPLDANLAEANDSDDSVKDALVPSNSTNKKTRPLAPGEISIPVESFKLSREDTPRVNLLDGYYGGKQLYFGHIGRNGRHIFRGGAAKGDAGQCSSESRQREAGRGGYPDWGFRPAMTPNDGETTPELKIDLGNGVAIDFIYVKPGTFVMGGDSTAETKYSCSNAPKHEVTMTKGYYLAKTELTWAQYHVTFGTENDREPNHPLGGVGPDGAERFCMFANDKTGREFRLPTEAEWEFAARAGTDTKWFFGNDPAKLGDYAWFGENGESDASGKKKLLQAVGQKKPNPWGFHDMYGNVWEIVADTYNKDYFANSPKEDPTGPPGSVASEVEFTVNVPQAGKYALTASVVTMNYHQSINVSVNGDPNETRIKLPFTLGKWQDTDPVVLNLKQGTNVLKFCRKNAPQYGVALNSLILKPVQ
jgi:hypothetical protein